MPNKTFYLNPVDEDKWDALPNKSKFIHSALNNTEANEGLNEQLRKAVDDDGVLRVKPTIPPVETPSAQVPSRKLAEPIPRLKGLCEHGAGKKFCKISSCKNYQFRRK